MAQLVKNLPAHAGDVRDTVGSLGQEGPLEKKVATHFRILAWKTPRTEEPGGLQSMGSQRVTQLTERACTRTHARARTHARTHTHTHTSPQATHV